MGVFSFMTNAKKLKGHAQGRIEFHDPKKKEEDQAKKGRDLFKGILKRREIRDSRDKA